MKNTLQGRRETGDGIQRPNFPFTCFRIPSLVSRLLLFCLLVVASGCGPKYTYPSGTVTQAVEGMLLKEDDLVVEAQAAGKTLGAVLYLETLIDPAGQVPKEVHEKMGQVMQAVTRVALSTDLPLDFCTVFIRDSTQGNELIVTRSIDDTRRANADAIGIEESINRTVFSQGRYEVPVTGKPVFKLKEVTLEAFLADQITQRIRFSFARDPKESKGASEDPLVLADGSVHESPDGTRHFYFSMIGFKSKDSRSNILGMLKIVNDVFGGYKFGGYATVELRDYLNRQKLVVERQVLEDFQKKKITEKELLDRYLTESQSVQEAFKLFGFNLPKEATQNEPAG